MLLFHKLLHFSIHLLALSTHVSNSPSLSSSSLDSQTSSSFKVQFLIFLRRIYHAERGDWYCKRGSYSKFICFKFFSLHALSSWSVISLLWLNTLNAFSTIWCPFSICSIFCYFFFLLLLCHFDIHLSSFVYSIWFFIYLLDYLYIFVLFLMSDCSHLPDWLYLLIIFIDYVMFNILVVLLYLPVQSALLFCCCVVCLLVSSSASSAHCLLFVITWFYHNVPRTQQPLLQ